MQAALHRCAAALALAALGLAACLEEPPDSGTQEEGCPGNLVSNPSFEVGTVGWNPFGSELSIVEGGWEGSQAVEVCYSDGETVYSMDDSPNSVPSPMAGDVYEVVARIRSQPTRPVQVGIREWVAEQPRAEVANYDSDEAWTEMSSSLRVESLEAESVDIYFASPDLEAGSCFQVDAVCLRRVEQ